MPITPPVTCSEGLIATIGATADTAFAANAGRMWLSVTNTHASQDLYVRFGAAATTALGVKIAAGVTKEWGSPSTGFCPGDSVSVIASGSATTFYAVEAGGRKM